MRMQNSLLHRVTVKFDRNLCALLAYFRSGWVASSSDNFQVSKKYFKVIFYDFFLSIKSAIIKRILADCNCFVFFFFFFVLNIYLFVLDICAVQTVKCLKDIFMNSECAL